MVTFSDYLGKLFLSFTGGRRTSPQAEVKHAASQSRGSEECAVSQKHLVRKACVSFALASLSHCLLVCQVCRPTLPGALTHLNHTPSAPYNIFRCLENVFISDETWAVSPWRHTVEH